MSLYAIDDLDDALAVTRGLLTPVDAWLWAKLAVVVLFVGGAGGTSTPVQWSGGGNGGQLPDVSVGPELLVLVAVAILVALVIGLAFVLVGSIMEFVFLESLRSDEVTIRRDLRRHWRKGVRLFAFRLVLGFVLLAGGLLLAASIVLPLVGLDPLGGLWIAGVLVFLPLVFVLAIVGGLIYVFTTVFVVPIMIIEECGVLAGWRRLWPTVTREWKQYLAFAVANFLLAIAGGIVVGVATALLVLVLLIPFGILFAIGYAVFALLSEVVGLLALALVGILFVLAVIAVVALVQVPVQTYLRYYALLVLGDVESDFDLIPDRRAAVRAAADGSA